MRKQTISVLMTSLVSIALVFAAVQAKAGNVWALLVGISKYQNPQIATLKSPAADATSIREALIAGDLGDVPEANVRLLTDDQATRANIMNAVDTFLKPNVKPGDQVILFLAGHGVTKGVGLDAKGYLLPGDVKGLTTAALEVSAVNLRTLSDKLGQLPAAQFVVFVDACREDPTPGRGVKGNPLSDVLSRGIQIMPQEGSQPISAASFFACSIGQRAFEDPTLNHGVFTYWILDGIRTAAAARKPDGAVDMGALASYVKGKVADWAKQTSSKGDFEVEQTPDFVATQLNAPIILMRVKKPLPDIPIAPSPPQLTVLSNPQGAQVTLDGGRIGPTPLTRALANGGKHIIKIEMPGYTAVERQITVLEGYELQVTFSPAPGARGAATDNGVIELYRRAQDAEAHLQWEVAQAGYNAILKSDDQFVPAYERLASLCARQGQMRPQIETLVHLVAKTPPTAHCYSLLATAYADLSMLEGPLRGGASAPKPKKRGGLLGGILNRGGGDKKEETFEGGPADYVVPKDWKDAAILARRAAEAAANIDAASSESSRALGFALIATDIEYKNRDASLAAFGKAVFADPKDAASQYGLGYGIRFFSAGLKDENERKTELQRAATSLKEALNLRPDYYEAHRELAFCYHLMGESRSAVREYQTADANRGGASDKNEVAALNLALFAVYSTLAKGENGNKKADLLAAANGYFGDARDITPDLTKAIQFLTHAQLSTRIVDYMPSELQKFLDLPNTLRSQLHLPDVPGLPRFP